MRFVKSIAVIAILAPAIGWSKNPIVRIEIGGVVGAQVVEGSQLESNRFTIWGGPGTSSGAVTHEADFADWDLGVAPTPGAHLASYTVTFFCASRDGADPRRCYVVQYAYDSANDRGYIYLPAPGEDDYRLNVSSVYRGVEGSWFHSTAQWERLMRAQLGSRSSAG